MLDPERWVPLAEIARPHGVKGEVRLKLFNTASDVLLEQDEVLVRTPDGEEHEVSVDKARRADDAILMKLHSVDDRDRADELRGSHICLRRKDFPPLEEGEYYSVDLVGALASMQGHEIGKVIDVIEYPTMSVLVVSDGKQIWELPMNDAYVGSVDVDGASVEVLSLDELEPVPARAAKGPKPAKAPRPHRAANDKRTPAQKAAAALRGAPEGAKTGAKTKVLLMRVDLVTLFPELFETFLATSFVGKAVKSGELVVRARSPRDHGLGKHRSVDDTPYGGGSGMVMRVDVMVACMEAIDAEAPEMPKARRVLLTPQGAPFNQRIAERLSAEPAIMLICGRYEGFDERVRSFVDEEVSLGDFVMTGGEVAAMAVIEATIRLVPGVLGNHDSVKEESHSEGLLEYPQFTRPVDFRGHGVPEVLAGGHHAEIAKWRAAQSLERTQARRPDLIAAQQEKK